MPQFKAKYALGNTEKSPIPTVSLCRHTYNGGAVVLWCCGAVVLWAAVWAACTVPRRSAPLQPQAGADVCACDFLISCNLKPPTCCSWPAPLRLPACPPAAATRSGGGGGRGGRGEAGWGVGPGAGLPGVRAGQAAACLDLNAKCGEHACRAWCPPSLVQPTHTV